MQRERRRRPRPLELQVRRRSDDDEAARPRRQLMPRGRERERGLAGPRRRHRQEVRAGRGDETVEGRLLPGTESNGANHRMRAAHMEEQQAERPRLTTCRPGNLVPAPDAPWVGVVRPYALPMASPPLSVLDLAPIVEGGTAGEALRNSLDLAQHVERWGYRRFWLAEHHNAAGIASAATAVVIAHVAAGTSSIRVG